MHYVQLLLPYEEPIKRRRDSASNARDDARDTPQFKVVLFELHRTQLHLLKANLHYAKFVTIV